MMRPPSDKVRIILFMDISSWGNTPQPTNLLPQTLSQIVGVANFTHKRILVFQRNYQFVNRTFSLGHDFTDFGNCLSIPNTYINYHVGRDGGVYGSAQ